MTFDCNGCGQEKDFFKDFKMMIVSEDHRTVKRLCKGCRSGTVSAPDVYFDGKPEENLADDPLTGQPRVFFSKGHKAAYLKERGLMEAGDRVHGAPATFSQNQNRRLYNKEEARLALKKVKEMGKDYRRQEYLRIVKEGQHHAQT